MEISFWIYAACALLVSIFQYHVIFDEERLPVNEMMPAWILPIYPVIILGPLAGAILKSQPSSAGTPILIGAIAFQGLGWMFGIFIYSLWVTRLTNGDLPDESKRPGMYVAMGPAGTLCALCLYGPYCLIINPFIPCIPCHGPPNPTFLFTNWPLVSSPSTLPEACYSYPRYSIVPTIPHPLLVSLLRDTYL